MVRNPRNLAKKFIHWLAYHPGRTPVGCGRVCGLVFNRISVRFLMALVQWCSGYVSFLDGWMSSGSSIRAQRKVTFGGMAPAS